MTEIFRRRYFISLSYMLVALVGFAAWMNIPLEMAPDLRLPSVTVHFNWGSTSPEVMEKEITRQVEQAATRLRNIEKIRSVSQEGRSQVTITFEKEAPVEYRILELQEYLFGLQENLPPDVNPPRINRSIPQELQEQETFMAYSISADRPTRELLRFAQQNIRLNLLGIEGLADIEISTQHWLKGWDWIPAKSYLICVSVLIGGHPVSLNMAGIVIVYSFHRNLKRLKLWGE